MPTRPDLVRELFTAASALPPELRSAFLQERGGGDGLLVAEVLDLLRADADDGFLGEDRLVHVRAHVGGQEAPLPERIGAFRILGLLGRGGMGIVYRAEQDNPRREIALKVLAPGTGGEGARLRFAMEAQALGRLQHVGIAQVFAAGTAPTPHGEQQFLAMELVAGAPLHVWAAARPRPLATRVALLVQIAEAVQHAHQKGIVHRDLKPGNVIVGDDDRPKVLDFGIARLIDDDRSRTLQTRTGEVLGTLAYMSPEQAAGDGERVDVRTDVYALGAIAYELLGGAPPIDVRGGSLTASLRRILEDEPVPLGVRDPRLRGDLQTIVAMALRKEPERRYGSAQAFADDLQRFLAHEPIRARPVTAAYVVLRFTRRHRGLVAGLLLALVALLAGTVVSVAWAVRADAAHQQSVEEARVANEVTGMLRDLLSGANPEAMGGRDLSARQLLAEGRRNFDRARSTSPIAAGRVGMILGEVLVGLGDDAGADQYMQTALDDLRAALPGDDPRVVEALAMRAWALTRAQRNAEAVPLYEEALAMHRRLGSPTPTLVARCLEGLARIAVRADGRDRAFALLAEARPLREAAGDPLRLALHWRLRGNMHLQAGELDEADAAYTRAEALLPTTGAEPTAAQIVDNIGALRQRQRRLPEAAQAFARALAIAETCYGKDSPRLTVNLNHLGAIQAESGQLAEAESTLRRAVALGGDAAASMDHGFANALGNLGKVLALQDRLPDAIAVWERALGMEQRLRPGSTSHRQLVLDLIEAKERVGDATGADAMRDELDDLGHPGTGR